MLTKYALIQNNKIIKFRDVDSADAILIPKLTAHNYLPVVESAQPVYDPITQMLELSYNIQATKVMQVWTATERPFAEAVVAKKYDVELKAVSSIQSFFDATDQSTKVTEILSVKDAAVTSVKLAKNNIELRAIKPVFPTATAVIIGED
jgi:hypothetical protein